MKLHFISCVPDDLRFTWEVRVFLSNLRSNNYSNLARILVYKNPGNSGKNDKIWKELEEDYPESKIFYYEDTENVINIIKIFNYIPLLRLYVLKRHFQEYDLSKDAIFYCDSDIIFHKYLDFSKFLEDDINYLSWTGSPDRTSNYIWSDYIDGKEKDVIPEKLEKYKKLDVLNQMGELSSLSRDILVANKERTGGAQYLLKNIDYTFWEDCLNLCCSLRYFLHREINPEFFQSEDKGIQSWCSDMWAVLYTLWKRNKITECPRELDFSWATDELSSLDNTYILHNAGVTSDSKIRRRIDKEEIEGKAFYKGNWDKVTPYESLEYLESIINDPISSLYCTAVYVKEIIKSYEKKSEIEVLHHA